ncbi:MAG: hypothetical protein JO186_09190 [Actinobacteria bacterium]|nr:hypothetical protein [Actinomycetota bacterium]MBV8397084.1 hypothetical protein [Actinomycetota bacterium]
MLAALFTVLTLGLVGIAVAGALAGGVRGWVVAVAAAAIAGWMATVAVAAVRRRRR